MNSEWSKITVEIGTLAFDGLSRAYSQRAAASFEQALPAALRSRPAYAEISQKPRLISMPAPGRQSPEAFGRHLAQQVARSLLRGHGRHE